MRLPLSTSRLSISKPKEPGKVTASTNKNSKIRSLLNRPRMLKSRRTASSQLSSSMFCLIRKRNLNRSRRRRKKKSLRKMRLLVMMRKAMKMSKRTKETEMRTKMRRKTTTIDAKL